MTLTERLYNNPHVVAETRAGYPTLTRRGRLANIFLTQGRLGTMVERARQAKAAQELRQDLQDLDFSLPGMPTEEFPLFAQQNPAESDPYAYAPWDRPTEV